MNEENVALPKEEEEKNIEIIGISKKVTLIIFSFCFLLSLSHKVKNIHIILKAKRIVGKRKTAKAAPETPSIPPIPQ